LPDFNQKNRKILWTVIEEDKALSHLDPQHFLTKWERDYWSRLYVEKRSREWLLGRFAAKSVICSLLDFDTEKDCLERLCINRREDGSPVPLWDGDVLDNVCISISHRSGAAAAAASRGTGLGIDLESIEPRSNLFKEQFLTRREQELVSSNILDIGKESQSVMANLIWCAKESVLKALRLGLTVDTRKIECLPCTDLYTGPPLGNGPSLGWRSIEVNIDPRLGDRHARAWWTKWANRIACIAVLSKGNHQLLRLKL